MGKRLMGNPFEKLDYCILGSILDRCDVADIGRLKCTNRALAHLLKGAVQNNISCFSEANNEEQ